MRYHGANSEWAKEVNRSRILNLLLDSGPLSRMQITERTRLTSGAISAITKEMLNQGMLQELGADPSTASGVGRPAILLDIDPRYGYSMGLELTFDQLCIVVCDLKGEVATTKETSWHSLGIFDHLDPDKTLKATVAAARRLLKASHIEPNQIHSVGVGIPGVVDHRRGIVRYSPNLGWEEIDVVQTIGGAFDVPVFVDNNVNFMALAECLFPRPKPESVLLFVYVGQGIGGGIIADGRVFHGDTNAAGELGHLLVNPDGPYCSCGCRGCLEAYAANPAILKRARIAYQTADNTLLHELARSEEDLTIEHLVEAAIREDAAALGTLEEIGRYLGYGIADAIHMINPGLVLITGRVMEAGDAIISAIREGAKNRQKLSRHSPAEINVAPYDKFRSAHGAAVKALRGTVYQVLPAH